MGYSQSLHSLRLVPAELNSRGGNAEDGDRRERSSHWTGPWLREKKGENGGWEGG